MNHYYIGLSAFCITGNLGLMNLLILRGGVGHVSVQPRPFSLLMLVLVIGYWMSLIYLTAMRLEEADAD